MTDADPEQVRVSAGGLSFACRRLGDGDRLALCLHGFPDDAGSMDPLLSRLSAAGFTAVAPYMRGYGPTDRAPDGDYSVGALAGDALGLADALAEAFDLPGGGAENGAESEDDTESGDGTAGGADRPASDAGPVLVGHDWGAVAGYAARSVAPGRFSHVVGMAVPPGFVGRLLRSPRQWLRSWYVGFFQLPWLPERALRAREFALVERLWRRWSPGWDYPDERIASVKATFRSPGTVGAALAYYRQFGRGLVASLAGSGDGGRTRGDGTPVDGTTGGEGRGGREGGVGTRGGDAPPVRTPTLVVAGADDGCIGADLFGGAEGAVPAERRTVVLDDAGHFVHQERPAAVADAVLSFVGG